MIRIIKTRTREEDRWAAGLLELVFMYMYLQDETHRAQVATAENLPLLNDAGGVEWQAGNGVATRESSERCVRQRI